ncbi:MAG: hypothetical protein MRZ94_02125 [Oscillospiraceae bacterium]|nr:hypothetical protein [Oscillospiraceae bacterium]
MQYRQWIAGGGSAPRAAVHTAFAKPMALQPLLAALQTTSLFTIEDSIL